MHESLIRPVRQEAIDILSRVFARHPTNLRATHATIAFGDW